MGDSEKVAFNPVTGKDEPGVAGDENHRIYWNDQTPDGVHAAAEYGIVEQRAAGLGDTEMVSAKLEEVLGSAAAAEKASVK